jgi:large subunit ribosomal protein L21
MYAVIKTGGKQYRVAPGDRLKVESLVAEQGATVSLGSVLMLSDGDNITVGAPEIDGASVSAEVLSHGRGKKIEVIKFRRRKHYRRQMGHRQNYTELRITGITGSDGQTMASAPVVAEPAPAPAAEAPAAPEAPAASEAPAADGPRFKGLDAPQGEKDDLTRINGIGPVIEETLNGMGIFHFHQIAAFTEEDIEMVNDDISFPGRIEREEWISQAKELAG